MNWLLWLLPGIPAYLAVGQIWGRLTIAEFKNETPSEKLSLIRKGVRMLMFPTIHRDWKKKLRGLGNGMNLFCYFTVQDHGDEYSAYYTYNAAGETAYYHAITFLWPFKLLPAFYGALEIAFFALVALGQATVALSFIWLGDRLLTQKISGGSDVERSLEAAWEKFRGQKRQLEAADEQAASHIERLRAALAQGQLETTNAERQQLAEALAFFADHERRLEEMRELLDVYTHIHSARLNTDADRQAVRHGPSGHGPGCYRCGDRRE